MATQGLDPAASGTIGQYRLEEPIGGGGFALIYRATDVSDGATVALKLLRPEYAHNPDFVRRFRQEAEVALSLPDHPHIVKAIEFGAHAGKFYLAMAYVEGRDLSKALEGGRRLPATQVVSIGLHIASALQTAHSRGIFHRDIKPENIRLTNGGAKLLDFGIARPAGARRLTETGEVVGTPEYIPPEVWHGRDADARSDVYALGVVLYEAIAGRVPFRGNTPAAVMNQHLFAALPPLGGSRAGLPAGLESIIRKALARDPAMRFRTAEELRRALETPDRPAALSEGQDTRPVVQGATPPQAATMRSPTHAVGSGVPVAYVFRQGVPFALKPHVTVIGRDTPSDLVFADRELNTQHARVDLRGNTYTLLDLGSANGTYVNGRRLTTALALRDGDQIRLGQTSLVFSAPKFGGSPASDLARLAPGASVANVGFWAAVCHGCVLFVIATPSMPMLWAAVPLVLWLLAGRSSPYLGFHARQAAAYQVTVALVLMTLQVVDRPLVPVAWLAAVAYAAVAALACVQGRDFRYPVVSALVGPPR